MSVWYVLFTCEKQELCKTCKFYVVDSRFNPILGVNSACSLGLLKFTEPMFENWTDTTPISSSELNIDAVWKTSKDLSPDKVSNVSDIPETLTREWIYLS